MDEAKGKNGARRGRRILLVLVAPLWMPIFLLAQAIALCGEGLLLLFGRHGAPRGLRWFVGIPGLIFFPALVGLRAIANLLQGLGERVLRRRGRPRPGAGASLAMGLPVALLTPVWLPVALLVWLVRWVIWSLLIPEFERSLGARHDAGSSRLVTFIGLRYLFGRRETALHSATSHFAAAGIALGVAALIVVLSVMSGFNTEVKTRIVGTHAHVILLRYGTEGVVYSDSLAALLAGHPEVVAVSPFVYNKAMLSAGDAAEGAVVKGIVWDEEVGVTALAKYVKTDRARPQLARGEDQIPGIVLGKHIAENLGLLEGDELLLVSPAESRRTPLGFVPRMRRFRLEGIFDSGMYDFDASMAFIDLAEGQSFFGLGERITGYEIRIRDMDRAPELADELVALVGGFPYRANNWIDLNQNLFSWMKTEKRVMFIILIMIILVAGFNIASSLVMLVTEKRKEVGILKSMGIPSISILRIFVLEGWVMAFSGTAAGTVVGLLLCHLLERYRFIALPEDVYFIDTLPVRVEWGDVWVIVASVLLIAALSTVYPAWRAARVDPIEAIRSE